MDSTLSSSSKTSSVCRDFYQKFPKGKERIPQKLVEFLLNHESTRLKVDEWLQQAAINNGKEKLRSNPTSSSSVNNGKSNEKSTNERELGNQYFKKKNLSKCLHHYNAAVKYARFPVIPIPTQLHDADSPLVGAADDVNRRETNEDDCLAIALANRSAVYMELGDAFYDKALQDVELSIKYGYPERLKSKAILRKATIHIKKGNVAAAESCLKEITEEGQCHCSNLSADSANKGCDCTVKAEGINKKINELDNQIKSLKIKHKLRKDESEDKQILRLIDFTESNDFENASTYVCINTAESLGRYVVAVDDIEEGSVLFKELPFASVLLPDFYDSHCHHCHEKLQDYEGEPCFFPCRRCSQVLFCSFQCFSDAEVYHNVECGSLNFLQSVGIAHLAIRIILTAGVTNILHCAKNHELLLSSLLQPNLEIFKKGGDNYHRVYSLMDHIPEMYEEDIFQYTLTAALLTTFLTRKSKTFGDVQRHELLDISGVLLRHVCQLVCNAHAITDVVSNSGHEPPGLVVEEYQKRVATAIFPAASIMNHSCDPNISFHFESGKTLLVKADRQIQRGQNIYNCYGPHYRRMHRSDRQETLQQQYFFNCNCNKCDYELKEKSSFADQFTAFKCQKCEGPVMPDLASLCAKCGKLSDDVKTSIKMYNVLSDLLTKGEYLLENRHDLDEAIELFTSCYILSEKILFKYNSQYGQICDTLARCYVLTGNHKGAEKYLKKSLQYVEARFGHKSPEYLRELKKYKDLEV